MQQPKLLARRFQLKERLGGGGTGEVYRALDLISGQVVAVKIVNGTALEADALEREFRALSALNHQGVIRVFDYGMTEGGKPYFSMELLGGAPLRPGGLDGHDLHSSGAILADLCRALGYLHSRGFVHGDLKPSNIHLIPRADGGVQVKLLDFGLVTMLGGTGLLGTPSGGTVEYMAPELLRGVGPDPRSDLYALGCVLYEGLSGHPPFSGSEPWRVLRAHLASDPEDPEHWPAPPHPAFRELLLTLLAKEPARRYQSADEVIEAFNEAAATSFAILGDEAAGRPGLLSGPLVGRAAELEQLRELEEQALRGDNAVALVMGRAGAGKSRLLADATAAARLAGFTVLSVEPEAGRGEDSGPLDSLRSRLHVFLPGGSVPTDKAPARAGAVAQLLQVVSQTTPLLVVADDLEGPPLVNLLVDLAALASGRLLMLASLDETTSAPVLRRVGSLERVRLLSLGKLRLEDVQQLLGGQVGPAERLAELCRFCLEHSQGNPGALLDLLSLLVARGHLRRRRGRFWLWPEDVDLGDLEVPPRDSFGLLLLEAAVAQDPGVRPLLAAVAVAGTDLSPPQLQRLAGLGDLSFRQLVARLQAQGLVVWSCERQDRLRLARGDARQLFCQGLDAGDRKRLHAATVALLLEDPHVDAVSLCRHAIEAGDRELAMRFVEPACAALLPDGRLPTALALCQGVLPLLSDAGARAHVLTRIGEIHLGLGRAGEAAAAFEQAALAAADSAAADDLAQSDRLWVKAAEALVACGRPSTALAILEPRIASVEHPETALRVQLAAARALAASGERGEAADRCRRALGRARGMGASQVGASLLLLLAQIESSRGGLDEALATSLEALTIFRKLDDRRGIAQTLLELGGVEHRLGNLDLAEQHLRSALEEYRHLGRLPEAARCYDRIGRLAHQRGDWVRALELWEEQRRIAERTGDPGELARCLGNLGQVYLDRGDLARAQRTLRRAAATAGEHRLDELSAWLSGCLGELLVRCGSPAEALAAFDESERLAHAIGAEGELVEVERRRCEAELLGEEVLAAVRRAEPALARARSLGMQLTVARLLRVMGAARRCRGQWGEAEVTLREAAEIVDRLHAPFDAARIELERAFLARDRQEFLVAQRLFEEATDTLRRLGAEWEARHAREGWQRWAVESAELQRALTRIEILEQVWRSLEVNPDLESLLSTILDQVIALAHAQRGFLVLVDEDRQVFLRLGRNMLRADLEADEFRVSQTIIQQVLCDGQTVDIVDTGADEHWREQRSVLSLGLRSAVCVPLRHGGCTLGAIYVDSRNLPEGGHARDLKLLEALAAQTAVLVSNLRLLEAEQQRSLSVASVVHELSNPLTAVLAGLDAVRTIESNLSDRAGTMLDLAFQQVRRLANIVTDLLALAKMDAGKLEWTLVSMNPRTVLVPAVQALLPLAAERGARLELHIPPELPPCYAHPDRIAQVVTNLVANALRFVPRTGGEVVLSATLARGTASGSSASDHDWVERIGLSGVDLDFDHHLEVRVRDNGPGIAPEDVPRLFQPFSQVGKTRWRGDEGTGLGLAICRGIVRNLGGRIWVESQPGKGAEFVFTLAVVKPTPAARMDGGGVAGE